MLKIKGENYNTVSDAAAYFGVSIKTIKDWQKKGIIPKPPRKNYGIRVVEVYPDDYLKEAEKAIRTYRKKQSRVKRRHP